MHNIIIEGSGIYIIQDVYITCGYYNYTYISQGSWRPVQGISCVTAPSLKSMCCGAIVQSLCGRRMQLCLEVYRYEYPSQNLYLDVIMFAVVSACSLCSQLANM